MKKKKTLILIPTIITQIWEILKKAFSYIFSKRINKRLEVRKHLQ